MRRMMVIANHCSLVERCLLKGLRALAWDEPDKAQLLLRRIGVEPAQMTVFESLVHVIGQLVPAFDLLGPASPYIMPDEWDLLAALAQVSRKSKGARLPAQHPLPPVLDPLIEACGLTLAQAGVALKSRMLSTRR